MKYLILICLSVSLISCEKWFDYRNQFIGDYQCFYFKTRTLYSNDYPAWTDTLILAYDTILAVTKGEVRDEIEFLDWNWKIMEDGIIDSSYSVRGDCNGVDNSPLLKFSNDSIILSGACNFGHGSKYDYTVHGVKIP